MDRFRRAYEPIIGKRLQVYLILKHTNMRTTNKEVVQKIQAHILEYYEDLEMFREDMEAIKYGNMGDYQAIKELVNGGSFLVYNQEVEQFLNSLKINEENKEYDNVESWALYCHLIAREGLKLIAKD